MKKPIAKPKSIHPATKDYSGLLGGIAELLDTARRTSVRAVNALMTAAYWEIGRRIVEFEQGGEKRAGYGEELLERLSTDLTLRLGRGFSRQNLQRFRQFYLAVTPSMICPTLSGKLTANKSGAEIAQTLSAESPKEIWQTASANSGPSPICSTPLSIFQTPSEKPLASRFALADLARAFPLPWSHYVLLVSGSRSPEALEFYHTEALRGGWSVRQLRRQMDSQFYERTALSRNKTAMLAKGSQARPEDAITADEEIRDPLVLEFLGLKDEYSESDLEEALIRHLENFLIELGGGFAFVGRQKRLRIDHEWFRIDLLFFHRRLRSLVVIDLKTGPLSHADVGQMHLYINYARAHWCEPGENPPIGLILCTEKGESLARYALEGLPNAMLVREYLTALPDEKRLAAEITAARTKLEARRA